MKKILLCVIGFVLIASVGFADTSSKGIKNLTLTVANTVYSYTMPDAVTGFTIQCETSNAVQMGYSSGTSGTEYWTIKSGTAFSNSSPIYTNADTLYFQSSTAGAVVQIEWWR